MQRAQIERGVSNQQKPGNPAVWRAIASFGAAASSRGSFRASRKRAVSSKAICCKAKTRPASRLSRVQQQALLLIGAEGLSYDQAAVIAGCEAGTVKSRVNRARAALAAFMSSEDVSHAPRTSSECRAP